MWSWVAGGHYVDQANLKLIEFCLPPSPKNWDNSWIPHTLFLYRVCVVCESTEKRVSV